MHLRLAGNSKMNFNEQMKEYLLFIGSKTQKQNRK